MNRFSHSLSAALIVLMMIPTLGISQSAKVDKLVKLYFKGKEEKAISKMIELAEKEDEK